ncbi:MAG: signal peptidase I [Desulfomonile tiedjei]|nr:signal peptidase I [Desulfomonile tiedjei]
MIPLERSQDKSLQLRQPSDRGPSTAAGITKFDRGEMIFYTGPSMNPTLRAKDLLRVTSYEGVRIRLGDVIVFTSPQDGRNVTHRVVWVDARGLLGTRGDNNSAGDPWTLTRDQVQGKVTHAQNGERLRPVRGGTPGLVIHLLLRGRRLLLSPLWSFARAAYYWLARTGVVRRLCRDRMNFRVVSFRRPDGKDELHLLLGARLVGRLRPGQSEWYIAPPFRLVVDETSLPRTGSPQ